jgi:hypothetical protein
MIAASRRPSNELARQALHSRESSSLVKQGTRLAASLGGLSLAIGSGTSSSAASQRKNCYRTRNRLEAQESP